MMTKNHTDTSPKSGTAWQDQTYLVGGTVYLRPIEKEDGKFGGVIRPSLFPRSQDRHETWITEDLVKQRKVRFMAIVRKADDAVVGSVRFELDSPVSTDISLHTDPLLGQRGQHWKAEALQLVLPWVVEEQHRAAAHLFLPASEEIVIAAANAAGMRQTARIREFYLENGVRVDQLIFERLNSDWLTTVGDPNMTTFEPNGNRAARPVPAKVAPEGDPPQHAVMLGKRLYLRPYTKKDAETFADWYRIEPESTFALGRRLQGRPQKAHGAQETEKADLPETIELVVCSRETGEMVGSVALLEVDYLARTAETASYVHPDNRGKGYGFEAKHLLMEYAFERLGLHMVQSWILPQNLPSLAAIRKQGYRDAGQINWRILWNGGYVGFRIFDITAAEWRALPRENMDTP